MPVKSFSVGINEQCKAALKALFRGQQLQNPFFGFFGIAKLFDCHSFVFWLSFLRLYFFEKV
jgi:hypothetical protein